MVLINNGELEFSYRNACSPLCVAPLWHPCFPHPQKTLVADCGVFNLSCELTKPTALSIDSLVQERFLYTADVTSSQCHRNKYGRQERSQISKPWPCSFCNSVNTFCSIRPKSNCSTVSQNYELWGKIKESSIACVRQQNGLQSKLNTS